MKSVFLLEHLRTQENGEEDWKTIGIYDSRENALNAIARIKQQPGFCDYPNMIDHESTNIQHGFNIDEITLNMDHWKEGFGA